MAHLLCLSFVRYSPLTFLWCFVLVDFVFLFVLRSASVRSVCRSESFRMSAYRTERRPKGPQVLIRFPSSKGLRHVVFTRGIGCFVVTFGSVRPFGARFLLVSVRSVRFAFAF